MWAVYTVIGYFALALLLPVCWTLIPVWRRARRARRVTCPTLAMPAQIHLDPWFATRNRALGGPELRVRDCTEWPARNDCGRECLQQCGPAV